MSHCILYSVLCNGILCIKYAFEKNELKKILIRTVLIEHCPKHLWLTTKKYKVINRDRMNSPLYTVQTLVY